MIHDLGLVLMGVLLAWFADWLTGLWKKSNAEKRRANAATVLEKYGLRTGRYLATTDINDDELRHALVEFEHAGHIIVDGSGTVVGRIASIEAMNGGRHDQD